MNALLLAFVIAAPILGGFALTYLYDREATLFARLAAGVVAGQVLGGFIGYALAARFGLTIQTLWATGAFGLIPLLVLVSPKMRAKLRRDVGRLLLLFRKHSARRWLLRIAFGSTLVMLLVLLYGQCIQNVDGIFTSNHNNMGDQAFHLAVVQNFLVGNNYPPQHPEFAHVPLTYPFLVDFVSAEWMKTGANFATIFFLQNALLAGATLVLLQRFLLIATRRVFVVVIAPLILFLSGGWGFLGIRDDLAARSGMPLTDFFLHLPHDYTIGWNNYQWGNALTTLFTTQRGLLMAFPVALLIWTLWWQAGAEGAVRNKGARQRQFLAAGILAGGLPLVHGHTFLCVLIVAAVFAARDLLQFRTSRRWQAWLFFFVPALLLAVPQVVLLSAKSAAQPGAFFAWQPGWVAKDENWLRFWLRILGPFIPLLVMAWLWPGTIPKRLRRFYAPFVLLFALANLVRLAPWDWDNIKVLFYWHAASVPLVTLVLARLWMGDKAGDKTARNDRKPRGAVFASRVVVGVLFFCLTFSGALDAWHVASATTSPHRNFDADGIVFAERVQAALTPDAVLLNAPVFNHPAELSGRRLLLGYRGHLWSHGLDYNPRWNDVLAIYKGGPNANALLQKYKVWGVVIGPPERNGQEQIVANEPFFAQQFPVVVESGQWRVYRTAPLP